MLTTLGPHGLHGLWHEQKIGRIPSAKIARLPKIPTRERRRRSEICEIFMDPLRKFKFSDRKIMSCFMMDSFKIEPELKYSVSLMRCV